jgi:pimeloyl-ACP methyl ester carboxylesterase
VTLEADPTGRSVGNYATTVAFRTPGGEAADLHVRVALAVRPAANGTSCMVNYISIIDDSSQQYGLYLPSGRTPPSPVVFYMHGYGGRASASFSPTVTAKANAHGWILVNLDGRGNHFYDGAAETDLFEVLEDVDRAYGVDRSMVFLEGPSMGATGAFRHIARHPDVFAGAAGVDGWTDFNQWHRHWYAPQGSPYEFHPSRWSNLLNASCITHAENVLAGSLYLAVDGADTSVWPENGRKLHEKLTRLGTAHEYVHDASGGHCASYSQSVIHDWFHDNVPPLPADPENVRIRSNRLRTAKHAWMRIDRFVWNGFAELTAARGVGGSACSFSVTCRNVRRFTILSAPDVCSGGTYQVTVNGVACVNQPRDSTTFPLAVELDVDPTGDVVAGGLWTPSGGELAKSPEIEGPVGRALSERFVVAYGSANPAYTSKNQSEAQELCNNWADIWNSGQYGFHATIASVDEAALTRSDLTSAHLVIFGSEESSSLIQRMRYDPGLPFNLPADVLEDAVGLGPHSYVGSQYGIWMAYPNPLAPGRLVVVGHNVVGSTAGLTGAIFWTQEAYPWQWPEYVVFDTSRAIRNDVNGQKYPADQYLAAGDFGQDWGAPVAGAAETRVAVSAPASVPAGTASVTVTVTVEDELGAPVVALPGEAFDARLDGEARAAAFSEGTPGTYSPSILTSDLPAAGYDLTVEVVRPGAAGPVVGRGRARFTVY